MPVHLDKGIPSCNLQDKTVQLAVSRFTCTHRPALVTDGLLTVLYTPSPVATSDTFHPTSHLSVKGMNKSPPSAQKTGKTPKLDPVSPALSARPLVGTKAAVNSVRRDAVHASVGQKALAAPAEDHICCDPEPESTREQSFLALGQYFLPGISG